MKIMSITVDTCLVRKTLDVMGGKWSFAIIYALMDGKMRFNELERSIQGISTRMLIKELKSLEKAGVSAQSVCVRSSCCRIFFNAKGS